MADGYKIVWVLGAGFSRSLGAPLLSGLLSKESYRRVQHQYSAAVNDHFELAEGVIQLYEAGCYGLKRIKHNKEEHWEHAEEFIEILDNLVKHDTRHEELAAFCASLGGACKRFFSGIGPKPEAVRNCAVRMLAAECCEFLEGADPNTERWASYRDWAGNLSQNDTILTFNYDLVPDVLAGIPRNAEIAEKDCKMWIPSAGVMQDSSTKGIELPTGPEVPTVLKMHGSADWIREGLAFVRARDSLKRSEFRDLRQMNAAAVFCKDGDHAIATPGPTKNEMISKGQDVFLRPIWQAAEGALRDAHAIVFLGYRIPPTDASTRQWFIQHIRENCNRKKEHEKLRICTVLGADIESTDSRRVKGLLERTHEQVKVHRQPMRAEDFLALYRPGHLAEFYERIPGDYTFPPPW